MWYAKKNFGYLCIPVLFYLLNKYQRYAAIPLNQTAST